MNRPWRVLLVEDSRAMRILTVAALRRHGGFDVVGEAQDGAEATELAARLRPDVVLLDLRLPGADPAALAEHVQDAAPAALVAAFTGLDDPLRAVPGLRVPLVLRKEDGLDAACSRLSAALERWAGAAPTESAAR